MILDAVQYTGEDIIHKTILEPSFGDGAFLIKIVQRLIEVCKLKNINKNEIAQIVNSNIYGIEIDKELFDLTKSKLNILLELYKIPTINWDNLWLGDTLTYTSKNNFDYIVGNPPYIRIHNLDEQTRELIKDFEFSNGTTDMYILFFEKCIKSLSENGILGFITPNSYMKNTSQGLFRKYLIKNNLIQKIIDFKASTIFEDFSVYAAITILEKNRESFDFTYSEYNKEKCLYITQMSSLDFDEKTALAPWTFNTTENNNLLDSIHSRNFTLENFCTIQYGVATNRDKVYIGSATSIKGSQKYVTFNGEKIEKEILRPVVKGSTYDGSVSDQMIIFPYTWNINKKIYEVIDESEFKRKYPLAYKYLESYKDDLLKRDMDKDAKWYQFGRSQGLNNSRYKKLVFKNIISAEKERIEVFELPENSVVYSGIYITAQNTDWLSKIKSILETEEFCKYCKLVGKDMSGGWKNINSKSIKNYGVNQFVVKELFYMPSNFDALTPKEKEEYWNKYYQDKFLEKITESYNASLKSSRSTSKIIPIHSFIAEAIQFKLGDSFIVKADGYKNNFEKNETKEQKVEGKYYSKNVDISVSKNGKTLGSIGVKFICGNYAQNANNYFEGMLGETINLRINNQPYSQLIILPEFVPYYDKKNVCKNLEYIQSHHIEKYIKLNNENIEMYHRPDIMSIFLVNTGNKTYLETLISKAEKVNKINEDFINKIHISYSNIEKNECFTDEVKEFLNKHSNINDFLNAFTALIIANSYGK